MIVLIFFSLLSLDTILNVPELKNTHFGIYIINLNNDTVVYDTNADKLFVPASNMKIITTAAALYFLGADFRFKTFLCLKGQIKEKKLFGDIVLVGGGDPTFSLNNLEQFVFRVKNAGIQEITGDICSADDYFTEERLPVGWAWHYLDARYAPEISALSLNKNVVSVRIRPSINNEPANVSIYPATQYVRLINRMRTTTEKDSIIIFRKPEENVIVVDGTINHRNPRDIDVAIKDPGLFTGEYFRERLLAHGVKITGTTKRIRRSEMLANNQPFSVMDSIVSPPLNEIVNEANTESENLYAEILLKTLGAERYNEGSFRAGLQALKEFLIMCGVDTANVSLWDGSGLSKNNLVSPATIISTLKFIYHSNLFSTFYNSLPTPGNGTLKFRFNGFADTLRAKTGAIQASSCLSGYLKIDGNYYAFSLLFNNFTYPSKKIQKIHERILRAVTEMLKTNQTSSTDVHQPVGVNHND